MKNVVKTGLFALLLAFASCQNNSPAPQAAKQDKDSTATKPAEPTVLPNVKCYEGEVIYLDCSGKITAKVYNDTIGIKSLVGYEQTMRDSVITLVTKDLAIQKIMGQNKKIYFTVSQLSDKDTVGFASPCTMDRIPANYPKKYAVVNSISFKNCDSKN
jgi:hypothetical protein